MSSILYIGRRWELLSVSVSAVADKTRVTSVLSRHLLGEVSPQTSKPEVARPGNSVSNFCVFLKTTPYGQFFKILFQKFVLPHRSMLLCSNVVKFIRREIGEIVRYLPDQKYLAASKTVATARIVPKICQGQPPTVLLLQIYPNAFTFGGVIVERVNAVFCPVECFHNSPEAMLRLGWIKISSAALVICKWHEPQPSFRRQNKTASNFNRP